MPADTVIELYDYETAVEGAFKLLFTEGGIESAFNSADAPDDKRPRPRVEVYFAPGSETGHVSTHSTKYRKDTLTGSLSLRIIGNQKPEDSGAVEHSLYRATVRNLMASARDIFKADADAADVVGYLPYHSIQDIVQSGTSPSYEGQDGYYETSINYDIKFNIRPSAWPSE